MASGTPMTAASFTSGCLSRVFSISTALMVQPAEMITSSARPRHLGCQAGLLGEGRARLDHVVARSGIIDQHHADFGGAVHAAGRHVKSLLDEIQGSWIDRFSGVGEFLDGKSELL